VKELGGFADILICVTLLPWDQEAVKAHLKKTEQSEFPFREILTGELAREICAWDFRSILQDLDARDADRKLGYTNSFCPNLKSICLTRDRFKGKK